MLHHCGARTLRRRAGPTGQAAPSPSREATLAIIRTLVRLYCATHSALYELSGGRIAGTLSGAPVLLLKTIGRKSGKSRTKPLLYLRDGQNIVIAASYRGSDHHPAWYLNLQSNPQVEIRIGGEIRDVRAEVAGPEERSRLWPLLVEMYGSYEDYQKHTEREIPVVILRPEG